MLGDVQRNASYGAGDGANNVNDWVNRVAAKATLRGGNESGSTYTANGQGGYTTGPTGKVNTPTYNPSGSGQQSPVQAPQYSNDLIRQMMEQQAAQAAENKQRADALYSRLSDRANQSLAIDRNDPIIRAQADAFSANQTRQARNLISDAAEGSSQYANLEGQRRIAAEHAGQASGAYEAQLMGSELQARRAEIAQALAQAGGMLTADQANQLQRQLGMLDNAIRQQSLGVTQRGQDQNYDARLRELGLNEWDRNNYWDYARTFGL
jgi:hypothetical protein